MTQISYHTHLLEMLRSLILLMFCTGLVVSSQNVRIDYNSLQPCTKSPNVPGIVCGDYCRPSDLWCRSDRCRTCETPLGPILTNDTQLCGNTSFWSNKTCDIFNSDGEKVALGLRCTGGVQHCITPWYLKLFQVHIPIYSKVK